MFASTLAVGMDDAFGVEPPAASVVIPTRNRAEYLAVALVSLGRQQLDRPYEVLVVDDGSSDGTAQVARAAGVRHLLQDPARGLNAARNTGVRMTAAPLIAFLDDDVEVPAGWLAALVDGADRHPDAEAFGGPIRARLEGRAPGSCGREDPPITALDLGPEDTEADMVWGANLAIRRRAFERLGPFDEAVRGHGDEEDWLRALQRAGGKIVYLAGAGLDHRRAAYHRGRGARVSDQRRGTAPGVARELRVLVGCGWHIVRYACPQGAVMGAHAAGRLAEALAPGHRTTIGGTTDHGVTTTSGG
jgi:glycosyltransferase involved in cell wall biosynthesis